MKAIDYKKLHLVSLNLHFIDYLIGLVCSLGIILVKLFVNLNTD